PYRLGPAGRHSSLRCQCVVIIVCDYIYFRHFYELTETRHATSSFNIPVESVSPPCVLGVVVYCRTGRSSFLAPQTACHFAIGFLLLEGGPFVVELLAARQGQFHFGLAVRNKVYLEGDERNAFLVQLADQLADLPSVQEQFAHPQRVL